MKTISIISLTLISILLHAQSHLPKWGKERLKKIADRYILSPYITPQFLEADFSGDKKTDLAILIERKTDKKRGILVLFAQIEKSFIVGAGNKLGSGGDHFDWADTWDVFRETITYETTFTTNGDVDGEKEVRLDKPAIEIREKEGSGGLIYFDGRKFIWIHQGD